MLTKFMLTFDRETLQFESWLSAFEMTFLIKANNL